MGCFLNLNGTVPWSGRALTVLGRRDANSKAARVKEYMTGRAVMVLEGNMRCNGYNECD